jgi:acyl-CoA synthetase (AMP-forming)/AMP-acid ligase II
MRTRPPTDGHVGTAPHHLLTEPGEAHVKLNDLLHHAVRHARDAVAVSWKAHDLTYGELGNAVDRIGEAIGDLRGRRVLVVLPDSLTTYVLLVRLLGDGACVVPVSPLAASEQIARIVERVRPDCVITNRVLQSRHGAHWARCQALVVTAGVEAEGGFAVDGVPGSVASGLAADAEPVRMILFTSGSTGTPKGACLGDGTLAAAARMMVGFMRLTPSRRTVVTVPLYDYYGVIQIVAHLMARASLVVGETIAFPKDLLGCVRRTRATDLAVVPYTLGKLLAAAEQLDPSALESLEWIQTSSDVLTPELLERTFGFAPGVRVVNIYGLTEAGRACHRVITAESPPKLSIGGPSEGVELTLEGVTDDGVGEIVIRGPNVMLGYLVEAGGERVEYRPCSAVHTGDLASWDADGELILLGRRDHVLNFHGEKLHPAEIERVALMHPTVREAKAVPVAGADGSGAIELQLVGAVQDLPALQTLLRANLPRVFVPAEIRVVDRIERTELGSKIVRQVGG